LPRLRFLLAVRVFPLGERLWPEEISETHVPAGVVREEKGYQGKSCRVDLFCARSKKDCQSAVFFRKVKKGG
jgi:hypothetical protein